MSAKQQATRDRRVATAVEWLAEGKHHNWRYEARTRAAGNPATPESGSTRKPRATAARKSTARTPASKSTTARARAR